MDYVDFKNSLSGFTNDTSIGNTGYLRNRFGVDVSVRIQARTYYPQPQDAGQNGSITFGNKIFDPNVYINQMKKTQEQNKKLGDELKQGLLTLNQYYQQLKESYQEQNQTVSNLQDEINKLDSDGIFVEISSLNTNTLESWFADLANYEVMGVIIELTESTNVVNDLAASQIANAKAAGLYVTGFSHIFTGDGAAEGQAFLSQLQANSVSTSALVVLDITNNVANDTTISKDELNAQIAAFYKVLTDAGYENTCDHANAGDFNRFDTKAKYRWIIDTTIRSKPVTSSAWEFANDWNGLNVNASYAYQKIFIGG
ncbi:MAG: GH25 family lysozyme [Liquorilactobacillus ghanensis]|uniref:GH25 family lysozyme n=1 Tax=Liquorilactobacillus ghanensis TaxID=399370 RepID=UPI0039EC450B